MWSKADLYDQKNQRDMYLTILMNNKAENSVALWEWIEQIDARIKMHIKCKKVK